MAQETLTFEQLLDSIVEGAEELRDHAKKAGLLGGIPCAGCSSEGHDMAVALNRKVDTAAIAMGRYAHDRAPETIRPEHQHD